MTNHNVVNTYINNNKHLNNKKMINILILSGGGAKCIAYSGALKKLDELKNAHISNISNIYNISVNINEIVGISSGSIIGFLYAIGYNGKQLEDQFFKLKTKTLQKFKISNLLNNWGLDNGDMIIEWIEELCKKKDVNKYITFRELYEKYFINLRIGVTNLNKYKFEIFDYRSHPDISIIKIIRLSINLPFIYTKQEFDGSIYLDGGIINNYPIYLYKDKLDNVLGLKLISDCEINNDVDISDIKSFKDYIYNILYCYMIDKERKLTLSKKFIENTIFINTEMVNPIEANFNKQKKRELINIGYNDAEKYFKHWIHKIKTE